MNPLGQSHILGRAIRQDSPEELGVPTLVRVEECLAAGKNEDAAEVLEYLFQEWFIIRDLNAIFSFGMGAGIASWMSWRGRLSDWRRWARMLPIAVFSGLLFTWIGLNNFEHTLIGGSSIGGVDGIQALPGIAPATGAWLGAMVGAFIPFGLLALVRGFRGIEP